MQIEVDIGNTRCKWRIASPGSSSYEYDSATNDEFAYRLEQQEFGPLENVLISSVGAKSFETKLVSICKTNYPGADIFAARTMPKIGSVKFAYEQIENLGVDRALAMLAAYEQVGAGVMVIDAGSALTLDFVDSDGKHLGGYILPGYDMLLNSLSAGTKRVLFEKLAGLEIEPGASTQACVNNGVRMMIASSISHCATWAKERGISDAVFTGGNGVEIQSLYDGVSEFAKHLVFDGLILAKKYR